MNKRKKQVRESYGEKESSTGVGVCGGVWGCWLSAWALQVTAWGQMLPCPLLAASLHVLLCLSGAQFPHL